MAICHDFIILQDFINCPASVLLMHNNFTYHLYQKLRKFLQKNKKLNLLQTMP